MTFGRPVAVLRKAACLLVVTLTVTACGLTLSQGPPTGYEHMDRFKCTESDAGPTLDAVWASVNVLTVWAVSKDDAGAYDLMSRGAIIGIDLGQALLWGSSALVGYHKSKACRRAKQHVRGPQAHARAVSLERC